MVSQANMSPSRKKLRVIGIFVCLAKILRIFSNLKSTRSFFNIFRSIFLNIPHFIVEKDSEMKIGCYRGSGGHFFIGFWIFFERAKKRFQRFLNEPGFKTCLSSFKQTVFLFLTNDLTLFSTVYPFPLCYGVCVCVKLTSPPQLKTFLGVIDSNFLIHTYKHISN